MQEKALPVGQVRFTGGLCEEKVQLVKDTVIPYQEKMLKDELPSAEPSGAVENFRIAAGLAEGRYQGMVFQDSDLAKWLEAAAYTLADERDPKLEARVDEIIGIIAAAQHEDGYLNTYYTVKEPGKRWTNLRDNHELYCAGHMMEAAVAYYEATGKTQLLDVMEKMAVHIAEQFGSEEGKQRGYPGHEEIELALIKMYRITGTRKYLDLAEYFVLERGRQPHYFQLEAERRGDAPLHGGLLDYAYSQSHLPVLEQTEAVGHAVRATYLYAAMADLAVETGRDDLIRTCRTLWDSAVNKRMYITGGIGSSAFGEAFTTDYDLPPDTAYSETCAAIGLAFWARRMLHAETRGCYGDVMEKAFFNTILAGMGEDGQQFFYVNPLEVHPDTARHRHDQRHVRTRRQGWFGCACCPPNAARFLASLGQYVYGYNETGIHVHLYAASSATFTLATGLVSLTQTTDYPWDGTVDMELSMEEKQQFSLSLRIPGWCRGARLSVNGQEVDAETRPAQGYVQLHREWKNGDTVRLQLPMPIERVLSHPAVRATAGKQAFMRGPLVYCFEEVDNGPLLSALAVDENQEPVLEPGPVPVLCVPGFRLPEQSLLYSADRPTAQAQVLRAVPYFMWGNREPGEMQVWIHSV